MNKLRSPPVLEDDAEDELIQLAVEQKQAFDAALSHRDELVKRLVVPRHRVANTLADFYTKLTNVDGHSLAQEMEMFARFFELQTMLEIYEEQQDKLADLNRSRTNLLETIKSVNKNDRRLAQQIAQAREGAKELRNEAGRLRAYLKKHESGPGQPLPPHPGNERTVAFGPSPVHGRVRVHARTRRLDRSRVCLGFNACTQGKARTQDARAAPTRGKRKTSTSRR